MGFTTIAVTAGTPSPILNPDGSAADGVFTFLLQPGVMTNGDEVIEPEPIVATLASGVFSQTLPANNDPGTKTASGQPSTYLVVEQTSGSANREYSIVVPYDAPGGTIDISALLPSSAVVYDGDGTDQFTSYITVNDLLDWMQIDQDSITDTKVVTNAQRVTDMACAWVQRYVGRPVCKTQFAERHDGWSGSDIVLRKSPFLDLVLCQEWQSSGGALILPEATPEMNNATDAIQIDRATGIIRRVFSGYSWPRTFFPGSRNISVVYTAGFDPVPPDVWMATVEYASYWFRHTQQTRRDNLRGGSDPEQLDNQNGLWVGVPYRITALLDPYRMVQIG